MIIYLTMTLILKSKERKQTYKIIEIFCQLLRYSVLCQYCLSRRRMIRNHRDQYVVDDLREAYRGGRGRRMREGNMHALHRLVAHLTIKPFL